MSQLSDATAARLRMLESLAESPLRLPATINRASAANGAAPCSAAPAATTPDPELATALTLLKLEQEEARRLQAELAAFEFRELDAMISTSAYDFPPNPWRLFTAVGAAAGSKRRPCCISRPPWWGHS